ncbi:MAG: PEGA domain-containing protein, partial [bacterium]
MTRIGLCFILAAWSVGVVGARSADARVSRRDRIAARKLTVKGSRALRKRSFSAAIKHFIAAYKLDPQPRRVYQIALCHRGLGNYKHAIGAFKHYLTAAGKRVRARQRRQVLKLISGMENEQGRLTLEVVPKGAVVVLDGATLGTAPLAGPITVDPGKRTVKVTMAGYAEYTRELEFRVGRRLTLMITLRRIVRTGELVISSPAEGALVSIQGGKPVPLPHRVKLLEGSWQLRVTAPTHKPRTLTVA